MALRNIVKMGQDVLRKKSRPVEKIDDRICELLDDMAQTMYANDGVGLAAPQVGILRRMAVVDVGEGLVELINPEIISGEGEQTDIEGCLSVDGTRGYVTRPQKLVVRAYNRDGEYVEYKAQGLFARALCHEIDHLDGILFVDKMTRRAED